jgi:hypothetical protein
MIFSRIPVVVRGRRFILGLMDVGGKFGLIVWAVSHLGFNPGLWKGGGGGLIRYKFFSRRLFYHLFQSLVLWKGGG